jgi:cytochrome c oxidase subunit I
MTEAKRTGLIHNLFPSVVSGILLGVIGAIVANLVVAHLVPDNQDAIVVATYTGWTLFFFIGIGAFNGVVHWGFARREESVAEVLDWA